MKYGLIFCLLIVIPVVICTDAISQNGPSPEYRIEWTLKAEPPGPAGNMNVEVIGDKIFVVGGRVYTGDEERDRIHRFNHVYDLAGDQWIKNKDFPYDCDNHAATVLDGKIYVFGGNKNPEKSIAYVPEKDTYTPLAPMPTPRMHINYSAATTNGRIHVIGGLDRSPGVQGFPVTGTNEVYNPQTDSWESKAPLPTPRQAPAVVSHNGKIYACGGMNEQFSDLTVVEAYDPGKDCWEKKADMPEGRFISGADITGDTIVVVTGVRQGQSVSMVFVYSIADDTWHRSSDLPKAVRLADAKILGDKLYVIGGGNFFEGRLRFEDR